MILLATVLKNKLKQFAISTFLTYLLPSNCTCSGVFAVFEGNNLFSIFRNFFISCIAFKKYSFLESRIAAVALLRALPALLRSRPDTPPRFNL